MRFAYLSTWVVLPCWLAASSALGGSELQLRAGEKRLLPVHHAQGVTLDNPKIADTRIVSGQGVEVVGKGNGEGTLSIYTADGKTQTYSIRVRGGASGGEEPANEAWPKARFGGQQISNARCSEPLRQEKANQLFEEARALLKKDQTSEAIPKLDQVLKTEPDAAVAHLFLGAAWAKMKDQAKGAAHYESFVLSCPDNPNVEAVVALLREFDRQVSQGKSKP
ncbi:MAG TPA: pilus assembly protein N-terminal domain-containing protein [Myxococcaceae bacterium]|nr:pilus assembly protein N-terminal domain-containing protein [Myxococcaceae bacterium]